MKFQSFLHEFDDKVDHLAKDFFDRRICRTCSSSLTFELIGLIWVIFRSFYYVCLILLFVFHYLAWAYVAYWAFIRKDCWLVYQFTSNNFKTVLALANTFTYFNSWLIIFICIRPFILSSSTFII